MPFQEVKMIKKDFKLNDKNLDITIEKDLLNRNSEVKHFLKQENS